MLAVKVICLADAATIVALILNNYHMAAVGLIVLSAVPLFQAVKNAAINYRDQQILNRHADRARRAVGDERIAAD